MRAFAPLGPDIVPATTSLSLESAPLEPAAACPPGPTGASSTLVDPTPPTANPTASKPARRDTPRHEKGRSRRHWLKTLAAGSIFPAAAAAAPPRASARPHTWDLSADVDSGAMLTKLVRRITMGFTPAEMALAVQKGYSGYLEYHLNHLAIDDSEIAPRIGTLHTLPLTPFELYLESQGTIVDQLIEAQIVRSIYSKRQLFERMVEFWTDHFNIDITKAECAYLKTVDDRSVIRQHALGTFPQMLSASAQSAAMQTYLDNSVSTKIRPNENYARELLELHTLGVDGGFTQQDVENVAKCFTGWGVHDRSASPELMGTFRFKSSDHDQGLKHVLGHVIAPGGGVSDGLTVLQILAEHPSTARFIAGKLVRWLLGEGAPARVIDAVAATYTATRGDIKAMIRTTLTPNFLHAAPPRYKRPYHMYVSALRALNAQLEGVWVFRQWVTAAGQLPFFWTTPDGYPDTADFWAGSILQRWNFGASFAQGEISGVRPNIVEFFGATQINPDQIIDKLDLTLFGGEMDPVEKDFLHEFLSRDARAWEQIRDAVGLTFCSPGFQWY